jgi:orotidine-5'-phosphate decarboxylase
MTRILATLPGRSAEEAVRTAERLGEVAGFVVGPELLAGPGPALVSGLGRFGPVLVLAGLQGPAGVAGAAARRFADYGAQWVSVMAIDGPETVQAVARSGVIAVAVTLRRGQGDAEVASLRLGPSRGRTVSRLAEVAVEAGAGGVLCDLPDLGVVAQVAPEVERFAWIDGVADGREAARRGAAYLIVEAGMVDAVGAALG